MLNPNHGLGYYRRQAEWKYIIRLLPMAIAGFFLALWVDNMIPTTGHLVEGGIKEQTRQSLTNVKAILEEAGLTMANVVKTTVFMADMNDFADMNSVYAEFFDQCQSGKAEEFITPYPARSAVAVKTLPKGALVEIEVVAGL